MVDECVDSCDEGLFRMHAYDSTNLDHKRVGQTSTQATDCQGEYGRSNASATAGYTICPFSTLIPSASTGSTLAASTRPLSARARAYGSVVFESAIVLVRGTAPGMFVTQ